MTARDIQAFDLGQAVRNWAVFRDSIVWKALALWTCYRVEVLRTALESSPAEEIPKIQARIAELRLLQGVLGGTQSQFETVVRDSLAHFDKRT